MCELELLNSFFIGAATSIFCFNFGLLVRKIKSFRRSTPSEPMRIVNAVIQTKPDISKSQGPSKSLHYHLWGLRYNRSF